MHKRFRELLPAAAGASELVIASFVDIRGFSAFNEKVESVESAAYIKRVYLGALDGYFGDATFFKPTGDGLMIVWAVNEENLLERADQVLQASLRFVDEFSTLVTSDHVINFEVPQYVGIGLARGAASRLSSGRTVLDYSGRLLNVTARLMDLARPEGIVVHGNFGLQRLDPSLLDRFELADVYVRGIAETIPLPVYYLKGRTEIPHSNLSPITEEKWHQVNKDIKYSVLKKMGTETYGIVLPSRPKRGLLVSARHRHTVGGEVFTHTHALKADEDYLVQRDGATSKLSILCGRVRVRLVGCEVLDDKIKFVVNYQDI